MTDKITLVDLSNLQNETTACLAINSNNAKITAAIDNTLSRDGSAPNTMLNVLDMNSNQILNLPAPSTVNSPARLIDVTSNPTIVVPGTGTSGHTVPYLDGNNTWSGSNAFNSGASFTGAVDLSAATTTLGTIAGNQTWTGNQYFKSGNPWWDVKAFGAKGDGSVDDSAACQAAINACMSSISAGGTVYFPPGFYRLQTGLTLNNAVHLLGSGMNNTFLGTGKDDVALLTTTGAMAFVENFSLFGKGINGDTGTFGATNPALVVNSYSGIFRNIQILAGSNNIAINGSDNMFEQIFTNYSFSNCVVSTGANWFVRCAFDYSGAGLAITNPGSSYPNWQANHAYAVGNLVNNGGYLIQCFTAGTTGASAPANKNIGINMADGSAVWQFYSPASFTALSLLGSAVNETHCTQCDFSGATYASSITINGANIYATITDSVMSAPVVAITGKWTHLTGNETFGLISFGSGYAGGATITDNYGVGPTPILMSAGVSNFVISNNNLAGGAITIVAGGSNHYTITGNINCTVADGGTGIQKYLAGNVF